MVEEQQSMYEYRILKTDHPTASENQLNEFGGAGWELITIIHWGDEWYYYFKRVRSGL